MSASCDTEVPELLTQHPKVMLPSFGGIARPPRTPIRPKPSGCVLVHTRVARQRREPAFPKVRKPTCIALTVVVELRQLDSKVRLCSVEVDTIGMHQGTLVVVLLQPVEAVHLVKNDEARATRVAKSTLHGVHHEHPDVWVLLRGIGN